jgi:hypothetical protein
LVYLLSHSEYDEQKQISPCEIYISYLGAFGEAHKVVTTITQEEIEKAYKGSKNSNQNTPLHIVSLHPVSTHESGEVHFLLVSSTAQRIYISLGVNQLNPGKITDINKYDYTQFCEDVPNGKWKVMGVVNPPLSKNITSLRGGGDKCCADINFDHTNNCVIQSEYSKGTLLLTGLN